MLHQVQWAIMPNLPMARAIRRWNQIAKGLAAPWRQRRPQTEATMDRRLEGRRPVAGLTA